MDPFFSRLLADAPGITFLLEILFALAFFVIAMAWAFQLGRFKPSRYPPRKSENLRYLITAALTKIINDFRHLLALILVIIFALALAYSLYSAGNNMADIKDALEAVSATLGGLVGSIIGYYFGESKGKSEEKALQAGLGVPEVPPPSMPTASATDFRAAQPAQSSDGG